MHYCETLIEINCFEFKMKKQLINFFFISYYKTIICYFHFLYLKINNA